MLRVPMRRSRRAFGCRLKRNGCGLVCHPCVSKVGIALLDGTAMSARLACLATGLARKRGDGGQDPGRLRVLGESKSKKRRLPKYCAPRYFVHFREDLRVLVCGTASM